MEGPLCDDSLSCFVSVHAALSGLPRHGTTLGHVLNGATVRQDEYEDEDKKPTPDDPLHAWGFRMGALYETLATYTAFAVGGRARNTYEDFHFYSARQDKTTQLQVVKDGVIDKTWLLNKSLPVDELLPFCVPAAYGDLKTQTTVVDPAVRTAAELPSDEYAALHDTEAEAEAEGEAETAEKKAGYTFRVVGATLIDASVFGATTPSPPFLDEVKAIVRSNLVRANIYLVPYKVNVYGVGGFFKPHVDTPTVDAARMVGTVVVALPTAFEGGVLRVRAPSGTAPTVITGAHGGACAGGGAGGGAHGGACAEGGAGGGAHGGACAGGGAGMGADDTTAVCAFDWAPHSADTDELQWAAFFGDCVHEVEPVTAGNRVTLTYAIVVEDEDEDDGSGKARAHAYYTGGAPPIMATAPIISQPHVARLVAAAEACPAQTFGMLLTHKYTFSGISTATLKGTDRVLHDGFVRAGWRVTLRPVVYSAHVVGPYPGSRDYKGDAANVIYAFGPSDVARLRVGTKSETAPSDVPFVRCSSAKIGRVSGDDSLGLRLLAEYTAACEYTGNESCPEDDHTLYFAAALIVTRP